MGERSVTFCLFFLWLLDSTHFESFLFSLSGGYSPSLFYFYPQNCVHLYSFLPFFYPSLPPFFSDYRVDGLAKASSIIAFEQRCSLALCSSEMRPFSICRPVSCKYRTALSSQLRWTFTDNTRLFQTHHRSILLSIFQDIFLGEYFFSLVLINYTERKKMQNRSWKSSLDGCRHWHLLNVNVAATH